MYQSFDEANKGSRIEVDYSTTVFVETLSATREGTLDSLRRGNASILLSINQGGKVNVDAIFTLGEAKEFARGLFDQIMYQEKLLMDNR